MRSEFLAYLFLFLGIGMIVIGAVAWLLIEGLATWDSWRRVKVASGALVVLGLVNTLFSPLTLFIH